MTVIRYLMKVVLLTGLTFQAGHFVEHAVQMGVWLLGQHDAPYMSPVAMTLSCRLGALLFGGKAMAAQMLLGMEVLHLIGNGIFLATIAVLWRLVPLKVVRWALYVEGFHLYEHIMLTSTALFLGKAVGLSTFFGGAEFLGGHQFAVGYRVFWHFAMNLVPSLLVMLAFRDSKTRQTIFRSRQIIYRPSIVTT